MARKRTKSPVWKMLWQSVKLAEHFIFGCPFKNLDLVSQPMDVITRAWFRCKLCGKKHWLPVERVPLEEDDENQS